MSRDHYKGTPKNRDARLDSKGVLKPLSKIPSSEYSNKVLRVNEPIDGRIQRKVFESEERTIYVRTSGNDSNQGTNSTTDAVATWERAFELLDMFPAEGTIQTIDGTGVDWVYRGALDLPTPFGSDDYRFNSAHLSGTNNQYRRKFALNIRADLTQSAETYTINGSVSSSNNQLVVPVNESLSVNAHVGKILLDASNNQFAVVASNDSSNFYLSTTYGFTGSSAMKLCTQSSLWDFGSTDSSTYGLIIRPNCTVTFNGIKFDNGNFLNPPFIGGDKRIFMDYCHFVDGLNLNSCGPGDANITACYLEDGFDVDKGATSVTLESCTVEGNNYVNISGNVEATRCSFMDIAGVAVLSKSVYSYFTYCHFYRAGIESEAANLLATNCHFANTVNDCIEAKGGIVTVTDSTSSSCDAYGVVLEDGAVCRFDAGTTLSGSSGEVLIGGNASGSTWAGGEATDKDATNPQFCRIYEYSPF